MHPGGFIEAMPMEQGFNCEKLYKMMNYLSAGKQRLNSLIILRNGSLVMNMHSFPFHNEIPIYLNCCTESIISALVGIAIGEGFIKDSKESLWKYFPEYEDLFQADTGDSRKQEITLEDLLKMTTGLEWNDTSVVYGENSYDSRMHGSDDPIRFILEQPIKEKPGTRYNHCLGAVHLLSAILQKVSGMSTAAFAEAKLFTPLGITEYEWLSDKNGISSGNGLSIPAIGLAKIGQLFLQKGKWNGIQIIPENWIDLSTRKHTDTPEGPWGFSGCGYLWNRNRYGGYSAKGVGGQYLTVVPALKLVVVILSSQPLDQFFWNETLMETFIIPAARFPGAGHENLQIQPMLYDRLEERKRPPVPKAAPPLSKLAKRISEKVYIFKQEAETCRKSLQFQSNDSCILRVWDGNGCLEINIGLDDVYRVNGREAFKGFWEQENTFLIKVLNLQYNHEMECRYIFEEDIVIHEVSSPIWGVCDRTEGIPE